MNKKRKLAEKILEKLRKKGYEAYFAGGCVRDMVMGREPVDFDIVTAASPETIEKIFTRTVPVGKQFGVILIVEKGVEFQVATFRTEGGLKEDVLKRDFTINGLLFDPFKNEIIDFVEGQKDITKKVIRTIGNPEERFEEDKVRLMRALRFSVDLGFSIEDNTYRAIKKVSFKIKEVSVERLREELVRIMTGPQPGRGLELLDEVSILKEILPEVSEMKGVAQPKEFHPEGDVFIHTRLMLNHLKSPSLILAFSALFHDIGKPLTYEVSDRIRFSNHQIVGAEITRAVLNRFKFSKEEIGKIVSCVENHMNFMNALEMRESKLKRLFMRETFSDELELHRIDCLASHKNLEIWDYLKTKYEEYKSAVPSLVPLLRGRDLLKMGFSPGPIMGKILKQLEDLQLEGNIKTKKEAEIWVNKNCKRWSNMI